jgi:signal transduction histidine kinase/CheY-like chemotaxis protein
LKQFTRWAVLALLLAGCKASSPDIAGSTAANAAGEGAYYLDLKTCPLYARRGFDPLSISEAPSLDSTGEGEIWKYLDHETLRSSSLRIKTLGLPDLPKRRYLSPFGEKDEEFTILFTFTLENEELQRILHKGEYIPGLYLSGIGDNWGVYLNGTLLQQEIHLDGEGQIKMHTAWRSVYFPLDKNLFKTGTNALAFRIIGGPNYEGSGLFYVSPYFIGEYKSIAKKYSESQTIAFCLLYLFVGVYHFILFLGWRKEKHYLYCSFFSIFLSIYLFARNQSPYFFLRDTGILYRIEGASLIMLVPLVMAFIETLTIHRIRLFTKIISVFYGILIITQSLFSLNYSDEALGIFQISAILCIIYLFVYEILFMFINSQYVKWKNEGKRRSLLSYFGSGLLSTELGNLLAGMSIIFLTAMIDIIDSRFLYYGLSTIKFGFFMFVVSITLILAKKFIYLNKALEMSNSSLETQVKERTRALEDQTRLAEAASRAKTGFLTKMSHEIRTPMNAILGMVEILLRQNLDETEARDNIMSIRQAGTNLLSIINDILDISKIESGKLEIIPQGYHFRSLINDVLSIINAYFFDKSLRFTVEIDHTLPDSLRGDEVRLRQILINLLSNAVKYTMEGSVSFKIKGKLEDSRRVLLSFSVTDTGTGIKEEDLDKLFGEFAQFDAYKNKGIEGTGLGLAISRKLSRIMGGDISVESVYGQGSVFTAVIPQEILDSRPLAVVIKPEQKRSLVYEKRRILAESLQFSFENLGVPVMFCAEQDTFFKFLETEDYQFVFFPSNLLEKTMHLIVEKGKKCKPVLMMEMEDASSHLDARSLDVHKGPPLRAIHLPIYTVPLADILNNRKTIPLHERRDVSFTAPEAKILIVDDLSTNLVVAKGLMSIYKMNITTCNKGRESIELEKKNRFDIIFMDHMMPEMDGIETAEAIRAWERENDRNKRVPIIALTANAITGMREVFIEKGFQDYLSKPIELASLEEILMRWLPEEKKVKNENL